jgi:hypothetical protein
VSHQSRLVLLMVATLGLGAATCRGRTKAVETPANTGDSGANTTDAAAKPARSGVYSCSVQIDEGAPVLGECRISPAQELKMAVDGIALAVALVPAEYGFAMTGKLTVGAQAHAVSSELFRQGAGSHAAVLLVSETTIRFALTPNAGGSATAR